MDEEIEYSYLDLISIQRSINSKIEETQTLLSKLKSRAEMISHVIRENDDNSQDWIVPLPKSILSELNLDSDAGIVKRGIRWQETIIDLFNKYDIPMNLSMIYNKINHFHSKQNVDKRSMQKNIAAALATLCKSEVVFKTPFKEEGKHLYGLPHHYDQLNNTIKPNFFKSFKIESGRYKK